MPNSLFPLSAGPQVLDYVWYDDLSDCHILHDVSGSQEWYANRRDCTLVDGFYVDGTGHRYISGIDFSGVDISGALLKYQFYFADTNGFLNLSHESDDVDSTTNFVINAQADLLNLLFTNNAVPPVPYQEAYNYEFDIVAGDDVDDENDINLDVTLTVDGTNQYIKLDNVEAGLVTDVNDNQLEFDLGELLNNDKSETPSRSIEQDFVVNLNTHLALDQCANTDVSNNLTVVLHKFGFDESFIESPSLYTNTQEASITFKVNALTSSAQLVIRSDRLQNRADVSNSVVPAPQVTFSHIIKASDVTLTSGHQQVTMPIHLTGEAGSWNYLIHVVDGRFVSETIRLNLTVLAAYHAPVVTKSSVPAVPALANPTSRFNVKYDDLDYNLDISTNSSTRGGMYFNFRTVANGVDTTSSTINDISGVFLLRVSPPGSASQLLTDVSQGRVPALREDELSLRLPPVSLSRVPGNCNDYNKLVDVSANYDLVVQSTFEQYMKSKKYEVYVDWLDADDNVVGSVKAGCVNLNTTFNTSVQVTNVVNNSYTFSYSGSNSSQVTGYKVIENNGNSSVDVSANATYVAADSVNSFYVYILVGRVAYPYTASALFYNYNNSTLSINNTIVDNATTVSMGNLKIVDPDFNIIGCEAAYKFTDNEDGLDILTTSITWPAWFANMVNPSVTYSIVDNNSILNGFDVSGNGSLVYSDVNNVVVMTNEVDISNTLMLDLSFNSVIPASVLELTITASGVIESVSITKSKKIAFYVPARAAVNPPAYTNIFFHNNIKLTLDETIGGSIGSYDVSTNSWKNLATTETNTYSLKLNRSEFLSSDNAGAALDLSGVIISAHKLSDNAEKPSVFFPFDVYGGSIGVSPCGHILNMSRVDAKFCLTGKSFINLKNFVGYVDITFNTISAFGNTLTVGNKVRIVVLPRPTLRLTVSAPTHHLNPNETAKLNYSLLNIQTNSSNRQDMVIKLDGDVIGLSVNGSDSIDLIPKIKSFITAKDVLIVPTQSGDIDYSSLFTVPRIVRCLPYLDNVDNSNNDISNFQLTFLGAVPAEGSNSIIIPANLTAQGLVNCKQANISSNTESLSLTICEGNSSIVTANVYANNVIANESFGINNLSFIRYIQLSLCDVSGGFDFDTDRRARHALMIVLENTSIYNITTSITDDVIHPGNRSFYSLGTSGENLVWNVTASNLNHSCAPV